MAKRIKENSSNHLKDALRRVILASLKLALERNWNEVSLGEIAKSANMPLIEVYKLFHSKNAILKWYILSYQIFQGIRLCQGMYVFDIFDKF